MTKEELEKEAEEYLENEHCKNVCTCDEVEECKKSIRIRCMSFSCKKELIVNFAEPREKQIEIDAEQIRALQKQNGELTDKVKELEHQLTHRNCVDCSNHSSKLRMRTLELEHQIKKMKCCGNCIYQGECDLSGYEECKNFDKWEIKEK